MGRIRDAKRWERSERRKARLFGKRGYGIMSDEIKLTDDENMYFQMCRSTGQMVQRLINLDAQMFWGMMKEQYGLDMDNFNYSVKEMEPGKFSILKGEPKVQPEMPEQASLIIDPASEG